MRLIYLFLVGLLLIASSCKEDTVTPTNLFGREWFNTFEQDKDGFFLYGPTNKAIGWRYDGFRLDADGTFVEYGLGPADAPETRAGTWTEAGRITYQIKFTDTQRQGYTLYIRSVNGDELQARRVY